MESFFTLERQASQRRREARAEVRRDRIGSQLSRSARERRTLRWQRLAQSFFSLIFSVRGSSSSLGRAQDAM